MNARPPGHPPAPGRGEIVSALSKHVLDYRHVLALIDPTYQEWRPLGKPAHRLDCIGGVWLVTSISDGVCYLCSDLAPPSVLPVSRHIAAQAVNEFHVIGAAAFGAAVTCKYSLDGQWRWSRNYAATASTFKPHPDHAIRRLSATDRELLVAACQRYPALGASPSTLRDFEHMAKGLPVACFGAVVNGECVGFCSASPIYTGITEISWIVVADGYRRRGLASGLLTAQAINAFARDQQIAYHAGAASDDLHSMLSHLGFMEIAGTYRFIPATSRAPWRTSWGQPV